MAMAGDGEDRGKTVHLPDQRGFERVQLLAQEVGRVLYVWEPDLVVVEGYAYCKNISSFVTLVEIGTMVRAVLYESHFDWVVVPPTVLKKWTTGRGNAKKEDMVTAAATRWGFVSYSHDIVDAYALAQMGQLGRATLLDIPGVILGRPDRSSSLTKDSTPSILGS
jgi:Holliday junction resolvasome RuvABC endonuclease subunit